MTTESMKTYPAYKDSGIEWIGEIPEGWKVKKLKWLADVKLSNIDKKSKDDELTVKLCNYVDVYYNDNITPNIKFMVATARKDQIDALSLEKGDVLITKDSESPDDIAVPAFVPESLSGIVCGYHLTRIRPNEDAHGNYLFRSFLSTGIRDQFEMNANGITRFGIGKYTIDNSLFLVPPLTEQQSIATFLDNQTAKIATLIENKQKQIELLKEERTAIINQAVTKGLNPDVPMRDSGIEWLGEIPEHWTLSRMRFICSLRQGLQIARSERLYEEKNGCYPYITIKSIHNPNSSKEFVIHPSKNVICKEDDIILARTGATGEVVTNQRGVFHNNFFLIDYNRKVVGKKFLVSYLSNKKIKDYLLICAGTTTIPDLNHGDFLDTPFVKPTLDEQKHIVNWLTDENEKIDLIIKKIKCQVSLLQEYRTALISEAVTGKIDLRNQHEFPTQK